jgi:hypothetical protein
MFHFIHFTAVIDMNSITVISFSSFYFQGLKKVEGDHRNSISILEKHLFSAEKKRVERETVLRYKCLLMMSKLYTCKQQFITLLKHTTFILFMFENRVLRRVCGCKRDEVT